MKAAVVRDFPDVFVALNSFAIGSALASMSEREGALAALEHVLETAAGGRGAGLFVAGEPGSGKSAFLNHARRRSADVFQVGWGQADSVEATVPFGVFSQAFRSISTPDLPEPSERMLAALPTSRTQAFRIALNHMESAAAARPVLIILDDLQCADPDSLALLAYLWRRIDSTAAGILGSFRFWPTFAMDVAGRLPGGEESIVRLPRLDAGQVATLLPARIGRHALPEEVGEILDQCRGNPQLVQQLILHLRGARIDSRIEGWRRTDLSELISRFIGESDERRMVASAASVFGDVFRPALAMRAARLDIGAARNGLEVLFQAGLFEALPGGGARFTHPLVRRVIYAALSPVLRAQLHAAAMRALIDHGVPAVEAAEHALLAEAAGDPGVVDVLAEAGQAALAAGDLAGARRYLEGGAAMAANGVRPRLAFLLGQVLLAEGEPASALSLFRGLANMRNGNGDAALGRRWVARALFACGRFEEAETELEVAVHGAEIAGDRGGMARAQVDRAAIALYTRGPAAALEMARSASTFQLTNRKLATAASAVLACAAYQSGDPSGLPLIESLTRELARSPIDDIGPLTWGWGVLGVCLQTAQLAERFGEADAAFEALYRHVLRLGLPVAMAALATARAHHLCQLGRLAEAKAMAEVAQGAARGAPGLVIWAEAVTAEILFETSQAVAGMERLRRAQDQAAKEGAPVMLSALLNHLAALFELDSGRPSRAAELYERVELDIVAAGVVDPGVVSWATPAIAAHLATGRLDAARHVVEWLERAASALPSRQPTAMAALGRAQLAEAEGDAITAEMEYRKALAIFNELPLRLAIVQASIGQARLLRIQGHVRAARDILVRAVELGSEAGAGRLEAQARQEIVISGGRFRQHRDPSHLTPQETRVAALARQGLSDRDIGRKLFISQKTVETHLMRVYRKMEVGNRRELMLRHA